ncbi:MAG: hypothetical protein HZB26_06680 [Candidatus Hydrogenedentes bacterium]|nr:hypothetical protein [Candidatus Hydrogenedentota bacterium]
MMRIVGRNVAVVWVCLAVAWLAGADPLAVEMGPNRVDTVKDFVADYNSATPSNALGSSATYDERCGGVSLPGIFLHPKDANDATLSFPGVAVPQPAQGGMCFLLFRIGVRDGVQWAAAANKPNGVRFVVVIDGKPVFQEDLAKSQWEARAIDMAPWAGKTVSVEFHTNAIDNNSTYDWSVFGQPMLATVTGPANYQDLPKDTVGVALAQVECTAPSTFAVAMGGLTERAIVSAPGTAWVPIHFTEVANVALNVENGAAELKGVLASAYAPRLQIKDFALSSTLVSANHPFNVVLTIKNMGLGAYVGGLNMSLATSAQASLAGLGDNATKSFPLPKLAPQEESTLIWNGLSAPEEGNWALIFGDRQLSFHVYPLEPKTAPERPDAVQIAVSPQDPIRATAANAWSRLSFVANGSGDPYAIAETWNGAAWLRMGSMYPLAALAVRHADGTRERLAIKVISFDSVQGSLQLRGEAASAKGASWPVLITYTPAADSARIQMAYTVTPAFDASLLAFYGPNILAGDGGFGAKKDFAIFPGLEYLEGDEESSSTRDLAYPLSDRRVPAAYKVATPLMAVQAQGGLIGLLWNAKQEWAPGQKYPAARFAAPRVDSGYDRILIALFAPSVGPFVEENRFEAFTPAPLKAGQPLALNACLVLDHASRYDTASIVAGPHKGGLVLQAMKQWFDVYGLPEPTAQPRAWDAERDLSRSAYFQAVWNETPPGWSHCQGWLGLLAVGHAVPLTLDKEQGVSEDVRKEIDRRIQAVVNRAIDEKGKGYLWAADGCHIMRGELPFYYGFVAESMKGMLANATQTLAGREKGLWVWRPQDDQHRTLGVDGDHTLGQAAAGAYVVLRAARLTGNSDLAKQALDAMKQMEKYEVPRGAQVWECPLYQPDILAAAQAIRAYTEAFRITGDERYLAQARYWAWTGLPFLYMWDLDGFPTMRYNAISVIGSTFFTHSWLGMPVVWCGLVYAYALQDLAEFDKSFDWRRVAQGITNSAMLQQYVEGPSKGCYPDSWNMVKNSPNPADINPENILVNEFRLRGLSPEIRSARLPGVFSPIQLNSAADIIEPAGGLLEKSVRFGLKGVPGSTVFTTLTHVSDPVTITGAGVRVANSDELQAAPSGWMYDVELHTVILKNALTADATKCEIHW